MEAKEKYKLPFNKTPFILLSVIDLFLAVNIYTIKKTIYSIKAQKKIIQSYF